MRSRPGRKRRRRTGKVLAIVTLLLLLLLPVSLRGDVLQYPPILAGAAEESIVPQGLVDHLAGYYRVSTATVQATTLAAYSAADESGVDPLLVLAVIGVESSFNPAAESGSGAQGLMQIVPRYHRARMSEHGGEALLREPPVNVALGTRILVDYIERRGGVEAGLQSYNGAAGDASARYARRVIAERDRLQAIIGGRP